MDVGCADAGSASYLAKKMRFLRQHILRKTSPYHGRYWLGILIHPIQTSVAFAVSAAIWEAAILWVKK
jgi:hypothetical protein